MNIEFILIVLGEPNSVFSEIIGKYFKKNKYGNKKIVIIGNKNLLINQLKTLKYSILVNQIDDLKYAKKKKINIINVNYNYKKTFSKITKNSASYIERCFDLCLKILKKNSKNTVLINGPVSKKSYLKNKYSGITEYLSKKTGSANEVMLIYNNKLSVSPLTTHIPIKKVTKSINKKKIINNILKIHKFYRKTLRKPVRFAVLGLNPHCETTDKFNEDEKIILPAIKILKKKEISISGPFSADTFFLKENLKNFDVVLGMYHDQVLTPIKTIYRFNAINITLGLPFIRISPDHGPNLSMVGKNLSDPSSFDYAMKFIQKLK